VGYILRVSGVCGMRTDGADDCLGTEPRSGAGHHRSYAALAGEAEKLRIGETRRAGQSEAKQVLSIMNENKTRRPHMALSF